MKVDVSMQKRFSYSSSLPKKPVKIPTKPLPLDLDACIDCTLHVHVHTYICMSTCHHITHPPTLSQKRLEHTTLAIATYVCCCQLSSKSRWWVGEGLVLNQPYITTFGIHSRTPYGYVQYNPPVGMSNEPSGAQLEPATISLNSSVQTRSSILGKSHFVTWLFFSSVDK